MTGQELNMNNRIWVGRGGRSVAQLADLWILEAEVPDQNPRWAPGGGVESHLASSYPRAQRRWGSDHIAHRVLSPNLSTGYI